MATRLRVHRVTLGEANLPRMRLHRVTLGGTVVTIPRLRAHRITMGGPEAIRVAAILDTAAVQPGVTVTKTAVLSSGVPGTPVWSWRIISGPTGMTLMGANTATVSFVAPSVMPGSSGDIVLGVTASVNGEGSPEVTANFTVRPQTRWVYTGGTPAWVGRVSGNPGTVGIAALSALAVSDRVGVQVHMSSDFANYSTNSSTVNTLVSDLGVKNLRDSYNVGFPTQHTKQIALATAAGAKFTMTARYSDSIAGTLDGMVTDGLVPYLAAVEGINEPDNPGVTDWDGLTRTWVANFYAAVRSRSQYDALPILAPALSNSIVNAATLGDISAYVDRANAHIYSGNPPTGTGSYTIDNTVAQARLVAGAGKPVVITEQGYHNAMSTVSSMQPVDEATAGVYAPRILLDNVRAGTERVFVYELLDQVDDPGLTNIQYHYGLCRYDLTKKPAFNTLKRLLGLLSDPGAAYTPVALPLNVVGGTTVRSMLVGKRDGSYILFLWRDVSVWNPTTETAITVAPVTTTVTLGTSKTANRTNITDGTTASLGTSTTFAIPLAGDVLAIALT